MVRKVGSFSSYMVVFSVIVLAFMAIFATRPAHAATGGFVHETTFAEACSSGIGVGITYDGTYLWYSCINSGSNDDLIRADPLTGVVSAHYRIDGGLGSLAYDKGRNVIWAGSGGGSFGCTVAKIQLNSTRSVTSSATAFNAPFCSSAGKPVDGLAYDGLTDQLYFSPDVQKTIWILTTAGTVVTTFASDSADGGGCDNSGVGLGGNILYEGFDGCSTVVAVDKATHAFLFKFSTVVAGDPNFRDESLTCDPNTFASSGQQVMWSKEAFSPMRAHAYEIPAGSCGSGGGVVTTGITLAPPNANNPVGGSHTVTATVSDSTGAAVSGTTVTFTVQSGPNAGKTGAEVTDASGNATFTYSDTGGAGTDTIVATFNDVTGLLHTSNTVTKTWTPPVAIATSISTSTTVPLGQPVTDSVTLSGGSSSGITGTITYNLFTNGGCTGAPTTSETVTIGAGTSVPDSSPATLGSGSYSFNATYSGDILNAKASSSCEPFIVSQASTTVATQIDKTGTTGPDVQGSSQPLATSVHDQATVSGAVSPFSITGTVTYVFYTTSTDCSGTSSSQTVLVGSPSSETGALAAGSYSYKATYNGDSNYSGSTSSCEPLTISQASTATTTTLFTSSGSSISPGGSVSSSTSVFDAATVGPQVNGFAIGGTVTFLFSANGCTGPFSSFDTEPVGTPSASTGPLRAGSYAFMAVYSEDSNYAGSTSGCEQFTVVSSFTSQVTRTQGFWATHLQFASFVFTNDLGGSIQIGTCRSIPDVGDLMGGFWSSVSMTTTGAHRSSLDQARMILMQPLLAAILNNAAFGSSPAPEVISGAKTAYCGTNVGQILSYAGILGTFNKSGDTLLFPSGTPSIVNLSRPLAAMSIADRAAWDVLP